MNGMFLTSLVTWSRIQFGMTACYHWLFVPLTLGLALIVAIMESLYVAKGDEFWKKTAKFWMKIFAINFAVGVATGIILEFEFGTNWSNYSWMVGDIFGAPLAIEGIFAFFIEATFFAVMFFGWNKVGKGFHLTSTWLTGIGATLSAYWILVANSWMQHPTGTVFNPETMRSEMVDFWAVIGNPVAVSKFFHAVFSGWIVGAVVTMGISCWYLLKKRETRFALASISVACLVGIVGGVGTFLAGDSSGVHAAKYQPMKLAAIEGLQNGGPKTPFSIVPGVKVPGMLSILATHDVNGFVPGIQDMMKGYPTPDGGRVPSIKERRWRGALAIESLGHYRETKVADPELAKAYLELFRNNEQYLGYGYLESDEQVVPPVTSLYWTFRCMIGFGGLALLVLILVQIFSYKGTLQDKRWLQYVGLWTIPCVYIMGECGWYVAEVGRQPWTIQGLLPVNVATSSLSTGAVMTTCLIFAAVFTLFLIIELRIVFRAVKKGPEVEEVPNEK
jgi:cytochrome d ubiquinol oxidase subunit I